MQEITKTLDVLSGIKQPESINKNISDIFRKAKKKRETADYYFKGIKEGNIVILSQAVTLTESTLNADKQIAGELINLCLPFSGKSVRIGITGVPGVGKSTFIETFGLELIEQGRKVAVLAIDPSSSKTGGSILGDKTRMEKLGASEKAFIRPSPSSGVHGGVAIGTPEIIILCETAGFDTVFVETVGVGQSEIDVKSMTDFFLLLMLAGAGDELQGIKRGIMETADAIIITKADGENLNKAKVACGLYRNALHLFPATDSGWIPRADYSSALSGEGLKNVANIIDDFVRFCKNNGFFEKQRAEQAKFRMYETVNKEIKNRFYSNPKISERIKNIENNVVTGKISPYDAAKQLLSSM